MNVRRIGRHLLIAAACAMAAPAWAQAPAAPQPAPRGNDLQLFQAPGNPPRPGQPAQPRPPQQQQAQPQPQPQPPGQPPRPGQPVQPTPPQPAPTLPTPAPTPTEPFEIPPANTMLVVVSMSTLAEESAAGLSIRAQLERVRTQLQTEAQRREQALGTTQRELEQAQGRLPREQFETRSRAFQTQVRDYNTWREGRQRAIEAVTREAEQGFLRVLSEVIGEIVQERSYQMVLNREVIIGFNSNLDITREVMRRLNLRLPSVTVPNLPQ